MSFGWNWPNVSAEEDFYISSMYFCFFVIISPLKKAWPLMFIFIHTYHVFDMCISLYISIPPIPTKIFVQIMTIYFESIHKLTCFMYDTMYFLQKHIFAGVKFFTTLLKTQIFSVHNFTSCSRDNQLCADMCLSELERVNDQ